MKNEKEIQLNYEKEHLKETREWIKKETLVKKSDEEKLSMKISELKKAAKGKYDIDLDTAKRLYEIVNKNVSHLEEGYIAPYFARIDFREYKREKESLYIGKFGLGDSTTGDEIVIDWRAPIADLYYSGTEGEAYYKAPIGVINGKLSLKRKFLYENDDIKDIFDEGLNEIIVKSGLQDESALVDEFLKINLEQSIGSKLKDVVATIQKEQNDIIRTEKSFPIIVQGSAGSGKTTIALHRLAYLLYRYKENLKGEDILVLAPNKLFLDYISEVLPNLGATMVKQLTFEELAKNTLKVKGKIFSKDKKLSALIEEKNEENSKYLINESKFKGSFLFKEIIERYVKIIQSKDLNIEDIKVSGYILVKANEIKNLYGRDMVYLPINKRKDEIKKYLKLNIKEKIIKVLEKIDFSYQYQIARIKKQMEDTKERREKLIEIYDVRDSLKDQIRKNSSKCIDEYFKVWKGIDTKNLYLEMFQDEEIFNHLTDGKVPLKLWNFIKEKLKNDIETGVLDSDDLAGMLYLKFLVDGVDEKDKFKHIVIDEAQDYSMLQLLVAKELALGSSMTIVGDVGQGIYYYKGINDWNNVIRDVFSNDCKYTPLTQSYRSTVEIIKFANKVLEKQENSLKPAMPVLRHGDEPLVIEYEEDNFFSEKLDEIVDKILEIGKNSVAVIGRNYEECKEISKILKKKSKYKWDLIKEADKAIKLDRIIIPSYLTKGLEFDASVVYNCNLENYGDKNLDKKLLYVALTRALHKEYIFYKGEKSPLICFED